MSDPTCPACGHANASGAQFCRACGSRLAAVSPPSRDEPTLATAAMPGRPCSGCGAPVPVAAQFCVRCGTPQAAVTAPPVGGGGSNPGPDRRTLLLSVAAVLAFLAVAAAIVALVVDHGGGSSSAKTADVSATSPTTPTKTTTTAAPVETVPTTPLPTPAPTITTGSPVVVEPDDAVGSMMSSDTGADSCPAHNPTPFGAPNAIDGDRDTAWEINGTGLNQWLELTFAHPVTVTQIGLVPGYPKVDPCELSSRWYQIRRITSVVYEFDDHVRVPQDFNPDERSLQSIPISGYRTTSIRIYITGTTEPGGPVYPGSTNPAQWAPNALKNKVAIAEVQVVGQS